jgi:hypothetical protein
MNSYRPPAPRAAFTLAAVAMTVLTLGLSVLPAKGIRRERRCRASASRAIPAAATASEEGMPIMVYGVRDKEQRCRRSVCPTRRRSMFRTSGRRKGNRFRAQLFPRRPHPQAGGGEV